MVHGSIYGRDNIMDKKIMDLLLEITGDEIVIENKDIELFESGLIDSLDFVELLIGIEENFSIVIAPSEIERESINTPNKIIEYILSRI